MSTVSARGHEPAQLVAWPVNLDLLGTPLLLLYCGGHYAVMLMAAVTLCLHNQHACCQISGSAHDMDAPRVPCQEAKG